MVRATSFALVLALLGSSAVALPQPPSATVMGMNEAFLAPTTALHAFEARATTTSTKKTTSSSTKKTTSSTKTTSTTKSSSTAKTTTTTTSTTTSSTAFPSVTNTAAFTNGAGNTKNSNTNDGTGKDANDTYVCYSGSWQNYPPKSQWLSFSTMWNYNKQNMYSACSNLGGSVNDNLTQIQQIYTGIQTVAKESLVDHRLILAVIVQESLGCVYVNTTVSPDGSVRNPGIMQSHNGSTYNVDDSANSILQMIRDGTEGTKYGDGLVQLINKYGNIYEAARGYNSGSVNKTNLNDGLGATASYVNDIANRMTGWLYANRASCPGTNF